MVLEIKGEEAQDDWDLRSGRMTAIRSIVNAWLGLEECQREEEVISSRILRLPTGFPHPGGE